MIFNHNISLKSSRVGMAAMALSLLAGAFVACVQIEDSGSASAAGKAYLSFSSVTVDYEVEGLMPTKANVPADDMPDAGDFTIRISGQEIEEIVIAPGELSSEPVVLEAGSYKVEAYYGSNGFDGPYFCKSVDVDLVTGQTKNVDLSDIPMANAMVALVLPDGISQHLDLESLQLTDGDTTIDVEPDKYVYAPSGKAVTAKFSGVNSLGEQKQISCHIGVLEPKHSYTVTCNLDLPDVQITLQDQQAGAWATRLYVTPATVVTSEISHDKLVYEAIEASSSDWSAAKKSEVISGNYHVIKGLSNGTAYKVRARLGAFCSEEQQVTVKSELDGATYTVSHTYSGDVLTGSTATADIGFPSSGILKTLHDAGLLNVTGSTLKYGSTQVRTLSGLSGEMTAVSGWPYLPKGSGYTFEVSHYCQGDTEDVKSSIAPIEVPAPSFTVGVSAETSYSRYQNYKNGVSGYTLDLANTSGTGDSVMDIKGNVTISNDILGNSNYTSLISATLKYDGFSMLTSPTVTSNVFTPNTLENNTGLLNGSDVISQGWGPHTVAASFTFDGVNASNGTSSLQCHVTGIPYEKDLINNAEISGWNTQGGNAQHYSMKGYLMWYRYFNDIRDVKYFTQPVSLPSDASVNIQYSAVFYAANTGLSHGKGIFHVGIASDLNTITENAKTGSITTTNVSQAMNASKPCSNPVNLSNSGIFKNGYMLYFSTSDQKGGSALGVYSVETGLFLAKVDILYN